MKFKHVINAKQFVDRDVLEEVFDRADYMQDNFKTPKISKNLEGDVLATVFYEESTRTRFSFESAMHRLGGDVISTENAKKFSSVSKGETLEDTIRIMAGYADAIVMRHSVEGSAELASQFSDVPILNAGDGTGEHPTQALLDVYTIQKEIGRIDDFNIAMVGDLKNGRTIHSLMQMLETHKNVNIYLVSPEELKVDEKYVKSLIAHKTYFEEVEDINEVLDKVDVVYMTRIQKERFASEEDYCNLKGCYNIGPKDMKTLKKDARIMHPLPRVDEIEQSVDVDPRAAYFRQAQNGLYIRMALLDMLIRKDGQITV